MDSSMMALATGTRRPGAAHAVSRVHTRWGWLMKADRAISPRWPQGARARLTRTMSAAEAVAAGAGASQARVVRQARCACAFRREGWAAGAVGSVGSVEGLAEADCEETEDA